MSDSQSPMALSDQYIMHLPYMCYIT